MEFVWFIVIGFAAGWLAGQVVKGGSGNVMSHVVIGMLGALLGGFLFRGIGVSAGSGIFVSLLVATAGAIVLLFVIRQFKEI